MLSRITHRGSTFRRPDRWIALNARQIRNRQSPNDYITSLADAKISNLEVTRYIFGHFWPDDCKGRLQTVTSLGLIALSKVAQGAAPNFLAKLMNMLADPQLLKNGDSEDWNEIVRTACFYALANMLSIVMRESRRSMYTKVIDQANKRMALELFDALQDVNIDFLLRTKPGELTSLIINSTNALGGILSNVNQRAIPMYWDITQMIKKLRDLQRNEWTHSRKGKDGSSEPGAKVPTDTVRIAKVTLMSYFLWSILYGDKRVAQRLAQNVSDMKTRGGMLESLQNAETVRACNTGKDELARFDKLYNEYEKSHMRVQKSLTMMNTVQQAILKAGSLATTICVADQIFKGKASVGALSSSSHIFDGIVGPLNFVGTMYRDFKTNFSEIKRGLLILKIGSLRDSPDAKPLVINRGSVQFRNVSFTYPSRRIPGSSTAIIDVQNDARVLKNINLSLAGKSNVAIVGPSGSGKSTLLRLLLRLYDPESGTVGICGQDLQKVTLKSIRDNTTLVSQETLLFNMSLRDNLLYGWVLPTKPARGERRRSRRVVDQELVEKRLAEVITSCGLTNLVEKIGLNGMCGERGSALSGGERQRVAVARAMLRNTPIVLLDEPTSGLDAENQERVMKAIEKLRGRSTVVQVAHKLATVVDADEIIYLENGLILERGTHEQLLQRKGKYAAMWRRQTAGDLDESENPVEGGGDITGSTDCSDGAGCCSNS